MALGSRQQPAANDRQQAAAGRRIHIDTSTMLCYGGLRSFRFVSDFAAFAIPRVTNTPIMNHSYVNPH